MLDFRINTFLCVCKHLSYTKAAEELCITQPAVSQHIRFLEDYYGGKLFTYQNRQLELTEAGKALKNAMLSIKHDTIHLKSEIAEAESSIRELRFGATLSIGEFLLPNLLASYLKKHPGIRIHFRLENTGSLLSALDEGSIDFAFIEGNFNKTSYESILVRNDRFIAVCGRDYPLEAAVSLTELFLHPLLLREDGSGTRQILEHALQQAGYAVQSFASVNEINHPHVILHLLSKGCGVSFMYETAARGAIQEGLLKELAVPGLALTHELNFIWRKNSIYDDYYKQLLMDFTSL